LLRSLKMLVEKFKKNFCKLPYTKNFNIAYREAYQVDPMTARDEKIDMNNNSIEDVEIKRILEHEITEPLNDGTQRSALYIIPFELTKQPTEDWIRLFIKAWNDLLLHNSKHRPGIASVSGNKIILNGTTIEEVEDCHREALERAVKFANDGLRESKKEK